MILNYYLVHSTIIHAIKYYFFPQLDYKGYIPLYGKLKTPKIDENIVEQKSINSDKTSERIIDKNFVNVFRKFAVNIKDTNIRLVFVLSPVLKGGDFSDNQSISVLFEIAKKENIEIIDFSNNQYFVEKYDLFYDRLHLNHDGATLFSELLSDSLIEKGILK